MTSRRSASPSPYDPTKLSSYSYAELRTLCKSAGVSAGGKASELRERLALAHGGEAHTSHGQTSHGQTMAERVMSTPLPSRQTTLPRIKTRVPERNEPDGQQTIRPDRARRSPLASLLKLALLLAVVVYTLDTHVCRMDAFTDLGPIADASCHAASRATREAASLISRLADRSPVDLRTFDIKNLLIKGVEDAHTLLLDRIEGRTKIPVEPLNMAVLDRMVGYNSKLGSVVTNLEEVWSGRHVSSEDKANAVVFACLSSDDCSNVELDISAVADSKSVLKVLADESTTRGQIQSQIATFLEASPHGVVVVPRVERWSPALLSVLNNCMGEGGSLMQDGIAIPTSSATWFLTARVDITPEMATNSVKLSLGVKKALMDGRDESDETVNAVLMAFRRRLDVVALGNSVSLQNTN